MKAGNKQIMTTSALILSVGVGLLFLPTWASPAVAQSERKIQPEDYSISVNVNHLVLNVTVTTQRGRLVADLEPQHFRIFEDGVEQEILSFAGVDRPLNLGLAIDSSRSMRDQRRPVIIGAMTLAALSHDDDEFFVVLFSDDVRLGLNNQSGFTTNRPALREALFGLRPDGRTALYDAVVAALAHVRKGNWERQAIVLFSDGGDTASQARLEDVMMSLRGSNAVLYAIGLSSDINPYLSPKILKRMARISGGEAFFPQTEKDLTDACESIAREIRSQYTLSYSPSNPRHEGKYRTIRVEVRAPDRKDLVVRAREGYLEPAAPEGSTE